MFEAYEINKDNTVRFTLGRYVSKPLVVFVINPSTATKEKTTQQSQLLSTFLQ